MRCPNRLVGIVSWGSQECLHTELPAVYVKVSVVKDWILYLCSAEILPIIPDRITKAPAIP
jgi:secreted trypsin-like serine protease